MKKVSAQLFNLESLTLSIGLHDYLANTLWFVYLIDSCNLQLRLNLLSMYSHTYFTRSQYDDEWIGSCPKGMSMSMSTTRRQDNYVSVPNNIGFCLYQAHCFQRDEMKRIRIQVRQRVFCFYFIFIYLYWTYFWINCFRIRWKSVIHNLIIKNICIYYIVTVTWSKFVLLI